MSKLTITRERLQEIAEDGFLEHGESKELARMALAALDSEPVAYLVCNGRLYQDRPHLSLSSAQLAVKDRGDGSEVVPLYRHAQQPVVDADDNFYSWFGREWQENYQHNQYTTAAKQMLGVMAESAWKAGHRAAMLQAGNAPVIPDCSSIMLRRWLVFGLAMQNAGSKLPRNLISETEEMLAEAAPQQEVTSARVHPARNE